MKTTINNVHSRFYGLAAKIPHFSKEDMVWQYSAMLTDSLSEFYIKNRPAYYQMVSDMQKMVDSMKKSSDSAYNENSRRETSPDIKKLRSGILHRLQRYGIDTTNWHKVNAFMEQPRIAGKRLYDMNATEMGEFIKKIESILAKDKKQKTEIERLAKSN
jgi:hypothetical protein